MSDFKLQGKKFLVTGAGRGIGRDIAEVLYEHKCKVYALSRTKSTLEDLQAKCPGIEIIPVDLENWDETRKAIEHIEALDGVVNNAAINLFGSTVLDSTPQEYEKIWKTNVNAVLNICQIVAKGMIGANHGGSIVNISSDLSQTVVPALAMYASTKAALDRLTRSLAVELGQYGIRANTVNPTITETDMAVNFLDNEHASAPFLKRMPLGHKALVPRDVTNTVLFLLSDLSSRMTGENLRIDGGYHCS